MEDHYHQNLDYFDGCCNWLMVAASAGTNAIDFIPDALVAVDTLVDAVILEDPG